MVCPLLGYLVRLKTGRLEGDHPRDTVANRRTILEPQPTVLRPLIEHFDHFGRNYAEAGTEMRRRQLQMKSAIHRLRSDFIERLNFCIDA